MTSFRKLIFERCRWSIFAVVSAAILSAAIPYAPAQDTETNADAEPAQPSRTPDILDETITEVVARYLEKWHYEKPKINNEVSAILFAEYFERLDPYRYYFLQTDIDEFLPYRNILDDETKKGKLDFAFQVYERFLERIADRVAYCEQHINEEFDFSTDERMLTDRKDIPWATGTLELDAAWRQRLKNQVLIQKFAKEKKEKEEEKEKAAENETAAEDATPEEDATEDPAPAIAYDFGVNLTPREKVLKRYRQYLKFMKKNDNADILEYYLTTLAHIFDPHSAYLNWRSLEDFDIAMRLSLQGIGATLKYNDGYTEVVSIIPGGPADAQGELKPGDKIVEVAQGNKPSYDVVNMPLNKVVRLIRGDKNTEVRLTVVKTVYSVPKVISIIRDEVKLTEQEAKSEGVREVPMPDSRILRLGVVYVPSFYADFEAKKKGLPDAKSTTRDVQRIIDEMIKIEQVHGLIIDLRSNGGGSLEEAIDLAGLFVPEGPVVQVKQSKIPTVRGDEDNGFAYDLPIVVMVNQLSASASEIFAGAIQDYSRGIIAGSKNTHGKGTVQTVFKLSRRGRLKNRKSGALKYTMAKFYRVTGASTQKKGIAQDIIFESFLDHMELGEAQLDHVLAWDTIAPREIRKSFLNVSEYVDEIKARSEQRLDANEEYQKLAEDIRRFGERKEERYITLKREKRIAMREEDEYWSKRSQSVLGKRKRYEDEEEDEEEEEEEEEEEKEEMDDLYLDEALLILADLISCLERDNKLAITDTAAHH